MSACMGGHGLAPHAAHVQVLVPVAYCETVRTHASRTSSIYSLQPVVHDTRRDMAGITPLVLFSCSPTADDLFDTTAVGLSFRMQSVMQKLLPVQQMVTQLLPLSSLSCSSPSPFPPPSPPPPRPLPPGSPLHSIVGASSWTIR